MKMKFATNIVFGLLLCPLIALATPVLSITPSTQTAGFNQTVTVTVGISGLNSVSPKQIVGAFELDVLYNQALLTQSGVAVFLATTQLGGANAFFDTLDTAAGDAAGNGFSLSSDSDLTALQGDSFDLFTISFLTGSTDGAAFLNFGPDANFQRLLVGLGGASLGATYSGACIAIGNSTCALAVPEPASLALVVLGIAGVGLARRRVGLTRGGRAP
jgi:hypothetical protein